MDTNKKNGNSRKIDLLIEKTFGSVSSKIVLVSSMKITAWKSYLAITFVAGFFAALIWGAYIAWYPVGKAADTSPTLHTYSTAGFHKTNENFTTDVILNTNGKNIVAVQAILSYDPSKIEVLGVDSSGTLFNQEVLKTTDNTGGKVFLALAKPKPGVNSSSEKIARISARAKKDFLEPGYTVAFFPTGEIADSSAAILDDGQGTNGLAKVYADFMPVRNPVVLIKEPTEGSSLSGTAQISADTQSIAGVASVEFFADGGSIASDSSAPFKADWDAGEASTGKHILTAKACDIFARCTTSQGISVYVNTAKDSTSPTVSISSPQEGANVSGTIQVTATASDDKGVKKVKFLIDDASKSTDKSAPFSYSWDTTEISDGSHKLSAIACDETDNCTASETVNVSVGNASNDKIAPVISEVSVSNLTTKSATVTWTTNEKSTSQISYGTDTNYKSSTSLNKTLVTSHKITISRLNVNTVYHFAVLSVDSSGNKSQSSDYSLTTSATR